MSVYCSFGFDPDKFWQLTLRELQAILEGGRIQIKREENSVKWAVWHTAYLPRTRRPIRFEKFMGIKKPIQSMDDQIKMAHRWTKHLEKTQGIVNNG